MTEHNARIFAGWFAAQRCGKSIIGWPCTRPRKHKGRCAYSLKVFERFQSKWEHITCPMCGDVPHCIDNPEEP